VHAPTEEKSDDLKDSLYEELEQVFDHFSLYDIKTLLDFNENWRQGTFQTDNRK
jgi:NTP pyrophosphatase (non-canonical NTP hydrolase)